MKVFEFESDAFCAFEKAAETKSGVVLYRLDPDGIANATHFLLLESEEEQKRFAIFLEVNVELGYAIRDNIIFDALFGVSNWSEIEPMLGSPISTQ